MPQFAKTVDLFCALLANLKRIHSDEDGSGCIHGDISAGNLFVDGSLSNGTILGVSLLDFGGGWDEETRPESDVFSTPGFRAPELKNGGTPTRRPTFTRWGGCSMPCWTLQRRTICGWGGT